MQLAPRDRHRGERDDRAHHPGAAFDGFERLHGARQVAAADRPRQAESGRVASAARGRLELGTGQRATRAMAVRSPTRLLRAREDAAAGRVAFVELFYDLVFVFAITQLSHLLLAPLHAARRGRDRPAACSRSGGSGSTRPGRSTGSTRSAAPVRVMIYASMLLGLFMSMSVARAFERRAGLAFALSFVAMQVGRSLFTAWCFAAGIRGNSATSCGSRPGSRPRGCSGSPAALVGRSEARLAVWLAALGDRVPRALGAVLDARGSAPRRPPTGTSAASTSPSAAGSS